MHEEAYLIGRFNLAQNLLYKRTCVSGQPSQHHAFVNRLRGVGKKLYAYCASMELETSSHDHVPMVLGHSESHKPRRIEIAIDARYEYLLQGE